MTPGASAVHSRTKVSCSSHPFICLEFKSACPGHPNLLVGAEWFFASPFRLQFIEGQKWQKAPAREKKCGTSKCDAMQILRKRIHRGLEPLWTRLRYSHSPHLKHGN